MNPFKRIQYNAPATLTFSFLSLAVLVLMGYADAYWPYTLFSVYRSPLTDPLMYFRLFGHALGHADINPS
jgi:hypothetical protein